MFLFRTNKGKCKNKTADPFTNKNARSIATQEELESLKSAMCTPPSIRINIHFNNPVVKAASKPKKYEDPKLMSESDLYEALTGRFKGNRTLFAMKMREEFTRRMRKHIRRKQPDIRHVDYKMAKQFYESFILSNKGDDNNEEQFV